MLPLCRETQSLGQHMLELGCENATVGTNGLRFTHARKLISGSCYFKLSISESCQINPNLDCNHTFLTDVAPNIIPFTAISIGKVKIQSKFGLV